MTNKGDLKTVNVLSEIRAAFHGPLADSDSNTAAVADDDSAVAEDSQDTGDIDPMDALVEVDVKTKAKPKQKKALNRAVVKRLVMPMRPTCAGRDGDAHRIICVFGKAMGCPNKTTKIYLRADSLDWLLAYAADEKYFKGVERSDPAQSEETDSRSRGNCSAVVDLRLKWDFDARA